MAAVAEEERLLDDKARLAGEKANLERTLLKLDPHGDPSYSGFAAASTPTLFAGRRSSELLQARETLPVYLSHMQVRPVVGGGGRWVCRHIHARTCGGVLN